MKYAYCILISLLTLCSGGLTAQQHIGTEAVIEEISDPLTHPMGYALDAETGEWIARESLILNHKKEKDDYFEQNMMWMRVARLKFQNRHYYMLFYQQKITLTDTLVIDLISSRNNSFLILDSVEYIDFKRLLTLKNGIGLCMISQINSLDLTKDSTKTFEQQLGDVIRTKQNSLPICFTARYEKNRGRELVHFRVGEYCFADKTTTKKKLDTGYFEVSYDDLLKILID